MTTRRFSAPLSAILVSAFLTLVAGAPATSAIAPPDLDPNDVVADDPSTTGDNDAAERMDAMAQRFGDYRNEAYKQAVLAATLNQAALYPAQLAGAKPPVGVPQWRPLGPTSAKYQTNGITLNISDSGRVRRILQDATDPDTVYVLTAGGGLWKTGTFSHTNPRWSPLSDRLLTTSGGNMAFGRNSQTLYVGLGDPFNTLPTLTGFMNKTVDGGATWSPLVSLAGSSLIIDVATETSGALDVVLVATDAGIFRSADGGASYAMVQGGNIFWSFARTSAGWLASSGNGGIFRSTDNGATWSALSGGSGLPPIGRTTLGVASTGDAVVYAFAATPGDIAQKDLFRSADGGLTWTALNLGSKVPSNPNAFQPDMNIMGGQAFYNQLLLVDSADASRNTVYIGGQLASAKSTDGGGTWTLISDWLPGLFSNLPYVHADHHAATNISLNGSAAIVFGTDGGIFVSSDGGSSFDFSKNDGIDSQLAQTVVSSAKNPQTLALGMQDTGTRVRLGSSGVFNQVTGGDGEGVGWSQANNAVALTTSEFNRVNRADNLLPNTNGNWVAVSPFVFVGDSRLFFTKIETPTAVTDPTGLIFLTATAKRLYACFDGARARASWITIARAGGRLPATFRIRDGHHGIGLDLTAAFNRVAVAGTGGRVALTLDGGFTWIVKPLIALVPGYGGFNTSPAWTTNGYLFVSSENPNPGAIRMVKSTDNGATWQRADSGLPDVAVFHVVADPSDVSGNTLYAGTGLGVYVTLNGGASWTLFGAGLPGVNAVGLWISQDGKLLRAATYGRGAWEINL